MKEHTVAVEKGSEADGWTYSLYVGGKDREEDADDETLLVYYRTSDSRHLQFQHFSSQSFATDVNEDQCSGILFDKEGWTRWATGH